MVAMHNTRYEKSDLSPSRSCRSRGIRRSDLQTGRGPLRSGHRSAGGGTLPACRRNSLHRWAGVGRNPGQLSIHRHEYRSVRRCTVHLFLHGTKHHLPQERRSIARHGHWKHRPRCRRIRFADHVRQRRGPDSFARRAHCARNGRRLSGESLHAIVRLRCRAGARAGRRCRRSHIGPSRLCVE